MEKNIGAPLDEETSLLNSNNMSRINIFHICILIILINLPACSCGPTAEQRRKWDEEYEREKHQFNQWFKPIGFRGVVKKVDEIRCYEGQRPVCARISFDRIPTHTTQDTVPLIHNVCQLISLNNNVIFVNWRDISPIVNPNAREVIPGDSIIKNAGDTLFVVKGVRGKQILLQGIR